MKISMEAELLILEMSVIKKVMDNFVQQEMKIAVREFLKATLPKIPQQTGFLRGSFFSVAQFVGAKGVTYGGQNLTNIKYYHTRGQGIVKSSFAGTRFVTAPQEVIQKTGDANVKFVLDNQIRYYAANDFGRRIASAPWGSANAGVLAMEEYLKQSQRRFPKIDLLLTKVKITAKDGSQSESRQSPDVESILSTRELLVG